MKQATSESTKRSSLVEPRAGLEGGVLDRASPTKLLVRQPQTLAKAPSAPMVSHAIKVLCVDDHAVLVEGLRAHFAIKGKIEIVARLANATHLIDEAMRLRPDVVLLDIEMPGPDAFETADRLHRMCGEIRVVMLSAHIRDAYITASFASGVRGYFAKSEELDDIERGIIEIVQSRESTFILGPKVRQRCRPVATGNENSATNTPSHGAHGEEAENQPVTRLSLLTSRESEILRLIGKGLSRVQIAAQISRSVKTIDGHQDRMMKKLGIKSRSELMRFSIREGLAEA